MTEETVTVGDCEVEIRETDDGFEAVEVEDPTPIEEFADELRENECVSKVLEKSENVMFTYDTGEATDAGNRISVPDEIRVVRMEANYMFDRDADSGMYVETALDE